MEMVMTLTAKEEAARLVWLEYCASGKKPADIPANPDVVYADEGWAGWCDWLACNDIPGPGDAKRPTDDQYIAHACKQYCSDEIEIDDEPDLSHGDDGCWVQAWVWVRDRDILDQ
jgi:hypothetical protein